MQLDLLRPENLVPARTEFSDIVIAGFKIVTASSLNAAKGCITHARVTGSVGGQDFHYAEDGKIIAWAIVERI